MFYEKFVISKLLFCKSRCDNEKYNLKIIENLRKIIFMIILFTYSCTLSFNQNIISERYFSNKNRILFIIQNQYLYVIFCAFIILIFDFFISLLIYSRIKIKRIKNYILILRTIFMIFLSYSIIVFNSIYPKTMLDLFIQMLFLIVTYYLLKLISYSILFISCYHKNSKDDKFVIKLYNFIIN